MRILDERRPTREKRKGDEVLCMTKLDILTIYLFHTLIETDSDGRLRSNLYHKRDDSDFPIVNFLYTCMCINITAAPAYGVYISQLIRYSRACGSLQDFLDKGLLC